MNVFNATSTYQQKMGALALLPRKQCILFAAEVARLVLPVWEKAYPEDKRALEAILAAESFDEERARKAADAAYAAAHAAAYAADAAAYAAYYAANAANAAYAAYYAANAAHAAYAAYYAANATQNNLWQTLQAIFDSAYHQGKPFSSRWRTRETLSLAVAITTERDCSLLPILQDALLEVGCEVSFFPPYGNQHWVLFNLLHEKE